MGHVIAWKECEVISRHILNQKSRLILKRIQELQVKSVFAQVRQIDRFVLYFGNPSGFNARMELVIAWKDCEVRSESNRSLRVLFENPRAFNPRMGHVIAWKKCESIPQHILNQKSRLNLNRIQEVQVKHVVAQVSQKDCFALYLRIRVDLMLEWDS
ncbi:uncharacterized protein G2W53_010268 [Senna tora]|uniref:Uncharacterized protein n=1 Tax=Senna tora TaxID=362788 RepID=A0A835C9G1_9FABA|nr:uncharacterized protein G2W53_010268 [Senna tora]